MKRHKKKRINFKKIIIAIVVLALVAVLGYFAFQKIKEYIASKIIYNDYYLSSNNNIVELYLYDKEQNTMNKSEEKFYRGTKVTSNEKTKLIENNEYQEIKLNDITYYIKKENLSSTKKESVKETDKYVRTSVTVYENEKDSKILSFIKKGNKVEIVDYDYLTPEGLVNMYKVKVDDSEGWIYRKYLVDTEEAAKAVYNENNTYDTHKDRRYYYDLYGGNAKNLDYYPYEKPTFESNPIVTTAHTMYLNAGGNVIGNIDAYLKIATESGVNAIVVDIKDGALAYKESEVAKEYSMKAYNSGINSQEVYASAIKKIKDAGIYVIGRIVAFNDYHFAADNPNEKISYTDWVSAYSRKAWEYNVELAKEAVKLFGFNEIQYDYVRFPESSFQYSKNGYDFKNKYKEEKAEAIQNFLFYAADQLHKEQVYLSADVFGECSGTYVTAYGQYWPAISNVVDVISSMPYTDHFGRDVDTWSNPYATVNNWAKGAAARQMEIPTPAIPRTWITAYNTPYWNPAVNYDANKISSQAQALVDAGLKGGFITWNSASNIYKYQEIKGAFAKTY